MNLALFTSHYPFEGSTEQTFLKEEIRHLSSAFDNIILIPRHRTARRVALPENVHVEEGYAKYLEMPVKAFLPLKIVLSPLLYHEISRYVWLLRNPPSLIRLLVFLSGAYLTQRWLGHWLEKKKLNLQQIVFYTYWFDQAAMGIGMAKHQYPGLKLVSRAHGYDLYEERYSPPYLPLRDELLQLTDLIFPDSEMGKQYLLERYQQFGAKFVTSRLGVTDPGFVTTASSDGVFRIVSCSLLVPVKRVDLLLEGIACAARLRPNQKIEWHHFGNGNPRFSLQSRADTEFPSNASAVFPGYESNEKLMDFYRTNSVDAFFNVSSSEGTPVAIMEAISCGIPVIATAVGGNREIVCEENGLLLSANPSSQEIAEAIFNFLDHPVRILQKRRGSLDLWRRQYHDKTNFETFIEHIRYLHFIPKGL